MVIFGTFKGFKNNDCGTADLIFTKITNDLGNEVIGLRFYKQNIKSRMIKLKFGNRYLLETDDDDGESIILLRKVKKNPKCDIVRRFKDEFHFIGGKYQGKKDNEINLIELSRYCIWLGYNSYNEVTIRNSLAILNKIHNK